MTNSSTRFDAEAATWDEKPQRVRLAQEVATAVTREVPLRATMVALDYGCGTGLVTLTLSPLVARVVAVDSSAGMVAVLRDKLRAGGIANVDVRQVDLAAGDQLDGSFDVIVSSMTLHHVADVPALVAQLVERLRPRGFLALADLDQEDGSFHGDHDGVRHHGFSRETLQEILSQAGLRDVRAVTATSLTKEVAGAPRTYPVFLMTGHR